MEQLENLAGVLGGFGLAVSKVEKNDDHFPVPKSSPPLFVVIKIGPGKWSPFFVSSRRETGVQELLCVS